MSESLTGKFERARRLYDVATLVHTRCELWQIDSVPLAHASLTLLMHVLMELHRESVPSAFEELARRTVQIAVIQSFDLPELEPDLAVIAEMQARFETPNYELTRAEWRGYNRAFGRLPELFAAVQIELRALLPRAPSRLLRHWRATVLIATALALGVVIGSRLRISALAPADARTSGPPSAAGGTRGTFKGTFYRDPGFHDAAATESCVAIDFDWGLEGPAQLNQTDHFSVRWFARLLVPSAGEYELFLTSDDGARLFVDQELVVDNWGSHAASVKNSRVKLDAGVHQIQVEYFEDTGNARIRLEWSSTEFARRLVGSGDLR